MVVDISDGLDALRQKTHPDRTSRYAAAGTAGGAIGGCALQALGGTRCRSLPDLIA